MQLYDEQSEPLHELLCAASSEQGATLLVPDLQRPYVWNGLAFSDTTVLAILGDVHG